MTTIQQIRCKLMIPITIDDLYFAEYSEELIELFSNTFPNGATLKVASDYLQERGEYVLDNMLWSFCSCSDKHKEQTILKVGDGLMAKTGLAGISESGDHGISISGNNGTAISGELGVSISGNCGVSFSRDKGRSISYNAGVSISGSYGVSSAGESGLVSSGLHGCIILAYIDLKTNKGMSTLSEIVGRNGIEPNTLYYVSGGSFKKSNRRIDEYIS